MRKVSFAWKEDTLVVERTTDNGYSRKEYQPGDLVCRLASTIGDAKHEFIDFLNATLPDKDVACLLINGRKAVVYGVANMGISITVRDGSIVVHSKDMAGQVACIIRREAEKNIVVIV